MFQLPPLTDDEIKLLHAVLAQTQVKGLGPARVLVSVADKLEGAVALIPPAAKEA